MAAEGAQEPADPYLRQEHAQAIVGALGAVLGVLAGYLHTRDIATLQEVADSLRETVEGDDRASAKIVRQLADIMARPAPALRVVD